MELHALDLERDDDTLDLFAEETSSTFLNRMMSNCCASSVSTASSVTGTYSSVSSYSSKCCG